MINVVTYLFWPLVKAFFVLFSLTYALRVAFIFSRTIERCMAIYAVETLMAASSMLVEFGFFDNVSASYGELLNIY